MKLSTYIAEDLKKKIQSGQNFSTNLTLERISQLYSVSLTPTRQAVKRLADEGYLIKHPNGRLTVNKEKLGDQVSQKAIDSPKTPEEWDRILMKEVVVSSLHNEPVYLREETLAKKFDIGRSIVRQTLSRFSGSGLIEHLPNRGWVVHPFKESDMWSYLEIREILELKALELAIPNFENSVLEKMLLNNPLPKENNTPRYSNYLHKYIIDKSNNRYIQAFFKMYSARYYTLLFDYATPESSLVKEMAQQHYQILTALMNKSWKRAEKFLAEHIRAQGPIIIKLLQSIHEKEKQKGINRL
jgi:DNA-binding GntR family transcriptional regulator